LIILIFCLAGGTKNNHVQGKKPNENLAGE